MLISRSHIEESSHVTNLSAHQTPSQNRVIPASTKTVILVAYLPTLTFQMLKHSERLTEIVSIRSQKESATKTQKTFNVNECLNP